MSVITKYMGIKNMSIAQLLDVCAKNRYIIARNADGQAVGINCGVVKIAVKRGIAGRHSKQSEFISFYPCGINEYISYKIPLIQPCPATPTSSICSSTSR